MRENTIMSFTTAGKAGAEYVELDVMLTKDRQAVIFHGEKRREAQPPGPPPLLLTPQYDACRLADFDIGIKASTLMNKKENLGIAISELTLHQLKQLRTTGLDSEEFITNRDRSSKTSLANLAALSEWEGALDIPTLKEVRACSNARRLHSPRF